MINNLFIRFSTCHDQYQFARVVESCEFEEKDISDIIGELEVSLDLKAIEMLLVSSSDAILQFAKVKLSSYSHIHVLTYDNDHSVRSIGEGYVHLSIQRTR